MGMVWCHPIDYEHSLSLYGHAPIAIKSEPVVSLPQILRLVVIFQKLYYS